MSEKWGKPVPRTCLSMLTLRCPWCLFVGASREGRALLPVSHETLRPTGTVTQPFQLRTRVSRKCEPFKCSVVQVSLSHHFSFFLGLGFMIHFRNHKNFCFIFFYSFWALWEILKCPVGMFFDTIYTLLPPFLGADFLLRLTRQTCANHLHYNFERFSLPLALGPLNFYGSGVKSQSVVLIGK